MRSRRFQALLDRFRKSIKEGKGLSEAAFWKAVRKRAQERKAAGPSAEAVRLCGLAAGDVKERHGIGVPGNIFHQLPGRASKS
jgi:hypothetical protein